TRRRWLPHHARPAGRTSAISSATGLTRRMLSTSFSSDGSTTSCGQATCKAASIGTSGRMPAASPSWPAPLRGRRRLPCQPASCGGATIPSSNRIGPMSSTSISLRSRFPSLRMRVTSCTTNARIWPREKSTDSSRDWRKGRHEEKRPAQSRRTLGPLEDYRSLSIDPTHSPIRRYPKPALFYAPSPPLDRAGRLRGHVVHHAVHPLDLVDDAGRDVAEELHVEAVEVGRHAVGRRDGAERHHVVVGAPVAHHADGLHRQDHRERLPDVVVEPGAADLLDEDLVGKPQ